MLGDLGTKRYHGIVCIMYFGGRVKLSKKVLDDGNNPPFIIRYRLGQCPRVAAEEKKEFFIYKNANTHQQHIS
jgi:hypothetical protein